MKKFDIVTKQIKNYKLWEAALATSIKAEPEKRKELVDVFSRRLKARESSPRIVDLLLDVDLLSKMKSQKLLQLTPETEATLSKVTKDSQVLRTLPPTSSKERVLKLRKDLSQILLKAA